MTAPPRPPRREENRAKIGAATPERRNTMLRMTGREARDHHHNVLAELGQHRIRVEVDKIGIERLSFGEEPHFVRVHRAGAHSQPIEGERHQRGGMKLPHPGQPRDQGGGRSAADPGRLIEQRIGLAAKR
jgi:hypothetical protein